MDRQEAAVAGFEPGIEDTLAALDRDHVTRRIWDKDATVWKSESARHQAIRDRLGWLDIVTAPDSYYAPLRALRDEVRQADTRTRCCSAWAAAASRRRFCARRSA